MNRNKTARQHSFAIVPSAEIPRSKFPMRQTRKMAFDASELVPIMCEEVLPGDTWSHNESIMARLATPIAPLIDDLDLETFYFFVPNRILWEDWEDFITGVNTETTVPKLNPTDDLGSPVVEPGGALDHFGILPQVYTAAYLISAFPLMAYFMIYNEWFRDQNLQEEWVLPTNFPSATTAFTQGGVPWDQTCLRVNKRSDYFTRSLPWPQKGDPITLPLGSQAIVRTSATELTATTGANGVIFRDTATGNLPALNVATHLSALGGLGTNNAAVGAVGFGATYPTNLYADLSSATAATINAIRLAFQTQKLLERDARGGSRYIEQLLSHFGVRAPDYRLQRPEYLGGSRIPITINPIAQTAAYTAEPSATDSAVGNLGAEMHASGSRHSFNYAATEHGYIIGLATVRATPTYQQGTRRHWKRSTRLDFFFPVFGMLGEQAVATQEIYQPTNDTPANATWGYQEHWAEYRYTPNEITGVLRSTAAQPLDWWHLSEEFAGEPALNDEFIKDKTQEVLARVLATAPSAQWSAQIIMDILHHGAVGRLMPTYSEPGMIDHF